MTKTKEDGEAGAQGALTMSHGVVAASANQADIDVHAEKFCPTGDFSEIAGQPFYKFDPVLQESKNTTDSSR